MTEEDQVRGNFAKTILLALCQIGCSLGQYSLFAHYLEPEELGMLSVVTVLFLFSSCLTLSDGNFSVVTRELAQGQDESKLLSNSFAFQIGTALFVSLLLATLYVLQVPNASVAQLAFFGLVPAIIGFPLLIGRAVLCGKERITGMVAADISGNIVAFLAIALAVVWKCSLITICIAATAEVFVIALLTYLFNPWVSQIRLAALDKSTIIFFFREAFPIMIISLAVEIYVRIDVLMIEGMLGSTSVAQYATAYIILDNLLTFNGAIMNGMLPMFSRYVKEDPAQLPLLYRKVLRTMLCIMFPIAVAIGIFAETILSKIFGEQYIGAATALRFLMLAAALGWLNCPSGPILFAHGKQRFYMNITILGVFVNVGANLFLIPRWGITGAAVATALTECVILCCSFKTIKHLFHNISFLEIFSLRKCAKTTNEHSKSDSSQVPPA